LDDLTERARALAADQSFVWHQRFELAPGILSPGANDMGWLMARGGFPDDLTGLSVLDVGTTNGAVAFEAERRGATRVLAIDICPIDWFGFARIRDHYGSNVDFLQGSIYDLPDRLDGEQFDYVVFWGVLYHLRHPLLALDSVRRLARDRVTLETAVASDALGALAGSTVVQFHRRDEFHHDASNWFVPSVPTLDAWLGSCGFHVERLDPYPEPTHERCIATLRVVEGDPEWRSLSYELPLRVRVDPPPSA
jgi:tRNA (mo5U34)-methyltransferase